MAFAYETSRSRSGTQSKVIYVPIYTRQQQVEVIPVLMVQLHQFHSVSASTDIEMHTHTILARYRIIHNTFPSTKCILRLVHAKYSIY
jgi:hypothetical protein